MLNTGRLKHIAVGNKFSAIISGGVNLNSNVLNETEEFNGSSWSIGGNLNTATFRASGAGIATSALSIEGIFSSNSEIYNGTTWSVSGSLNTSYFQHASAGIVSAAIVFSGYLSSVPSPITEKFNGTTWSLDANMNTGRYGPIGFGTQNDAVCSTGGTNEISTFATTESYNGTSWSLISGGDVSTPATESAGGGISNNAIKSGGRTGFLVTSNTEIFNGSTWSALSVLPVALRECKSDGEPENAILAGGSTTLADGQAQATTYKAIQGRKTVLSGLENRNSVSYTFIGVGSQGEGSQTSAAILGFSDSWVSGPQQLNTGRYDFGSAGDFNSAVVFGGNSSSGTLVSTEIYNGTSWSAGNDMTTIIALNASFGTSSAAVSAGGTDPNSIGFGEGASNITVTYNGSTWSTSAAVLSDVRFNAAGCGLQTAGIVSGGGTSESGFRNSTEHFNGTVWSVGGALNAERQGLYLVGIETASLSAAGGNSSFSYMDNVETYNGTTWTVATALPTPISYPAGSGIQNDALIFGGIAQPVFEGFNVQTATYSFNGSAWSAGSDLALGAYSHQGAGSSSQALSIGRNQEFSSDIVQYLGRPGRTELLYTPP